jgi:hypothetical protein
MKNKVVPRITLTADESTDSHVYAALSTARGLLNNYKISLEQFIELTDFANIDADLVKEAEQYRKRKTEIVGLGEKLWIGKLYGLHGEMAFHKYRSEPVSYAYTVALSYVLHGLRLEDAKKNFGWVNDLEKLTGPEIFEDACLNSKCGSPFCEGSLKIDVKTRLKTARREEGLQLYMDDFFPLKSDIYVSASLRSSELERNPHPIYELLGYALPADIKKAPHSLVKRRKLHPMFNLNEHDYLKPETVKEVSLQCT